jgi:hypothetical protein
MSQESKHLFRKKPTVEVVETILHAIHFTGFEDARMFQKVDLDITAFEEVLPLVEPFYLPCKAKLFLHVFSPEKAITVLRHLLRVHGYKLRAHEKVHRGIKQTLYQIEREVWTDLSGSMNVTFM